MTNSNFIGTRIEVLGIRSHSDTHVDIDWRENGKPRVLTLEYEDAGDLLDSIAGDPELDLLYARLAIEMELLDA